MEKGKAGIEYFLKKNRRHNEKLEKLWNHENTLCFMHTKIVFNSVKNDGRSALWSSLYKSEIKYSYCARQRMNL